MRLLGREISDFYPEERNTLNLSGFLSVAIKIWLLIKAAGTNVVCS